MFYGSFQPANVRDVQWIDPVTQRQNVETIRRRWDEWTYSYKKKFNY